MSESPGRNFCRFWFSANIVPTFCSLFNADDQRFIKSCCFVDKLCDACSRHQTVGHQTPYRFVTCTSNSAHGMFYMCG